MRKWLIIYTFEFYHALSFNSTGAPNCHLTILEGKLIQLGCYNTFSNNPGCFLAGEFA